MDAEEVFNNLSYDRAAGWRMTRPPKRIRRLFVNASPTRSPRCGDHANPKWRCAVTASPGLDGQQAAHFA